MRVLAVAVGLGVLMAPSGALAQARSAAAQAQPRRVRRRPRRPRPRPAQPAPQAPAAPPVPQVAFQDGLKYAYLRVDVIAANSVEGRAANEKVKALNDQKVRELNERNKALQSAQQKLEQGGTVLNDVARGAAAERGRAAAARHPAVHRGRAAGRAGAAAAAPGRVPAQAESRSWTAWPRKSRCTWSSAPPTAAWCGPTRRWT